ncbi:hypothetical protein [Candidatus Protochlamydia amoebophila]|uniref:Secreted protein n=1 Tax=Protochlamydia amoebophila (strain UWE25) TaxID=264201 RepID=Q6MA12_PARUW|nr:hypothetical protein [Candidatus Protochlamydia amoebophila]CAF24587.1 unnamed protein product [Candidatus Protochlamydia amoebophila UWE25]
MENKKKQLVKAAFAALVLASSPVTAQTTDGTATDGWVTSETLLATAGCGASDGSHGCGAATPPPKETSAKIDNILNNSKHTTASNNNGNTDKNNYSRSSNSNLADATSNTNSNWNTLSTTTNSIDAKNPNEMNTSDGVTTNPTTKK